MRPEQLEHLIRASTAILGEERIIVIGSQAILGSLPGWLPDVVLRSVEADLVPFDDPDESKSDLVDGAIGEGSLFHRQHGIYAHGVSEHTALLPEGWRDRLVPVHNDNTGNATGWCLEPHDLWVSKAVAGRPNDIAFCRQLLDAGWVDPAVLRQRIDTTAMVEEVRVQVSRLARMDLISGHVPEAPDEGFVVPSPEP